jgi:phosphoribosylanthranilate isomerase
MVRIKICGVTTPADAVFAAECGADAVGLNFFTQSPRCVSTEQATDIVRSLPPFTASVGVFVGYPQVAAERLARTGGLMLGLRAVQTYSDTPADIDLFPCAHIPAFRVKDRSSFPRIREFVNTLRHAGRPPAAVLVDSYVEGSMGGTGHTAPWELLAGFDPGVPLILAGGLTPDNVAEAIRIVRPWGVDVASGVESAPGKKDPGKVRAFVQAARQASP